MTSPQDFRTQTIARHSAAFELHGRAAAIMEQAVLRRRALPTLPARAVDMLFVQAFKALVSVGELAGLALVEDAATIVRRLLELGMTVVYIGRDSEESVRVERPGRYLAFLWHQWPEERRAQFEPEERRAWESVHARYGASFDAKTKKWGPTIAAMFEYAQRRDTYDEDYALLSAIAHGGPPSLVHRYSEAVVSVHDDREVSQLLLYGIGYALATMGVWNDMFELIDARALEELTDATVAATGRAGDESAAAT